MFPTAKFIYITKTPFETIPSSVKLWTKLDILNSFEYPIKYDYFTYSLNLFSILSKTFERNKSAIPSNSLYTIRFEDLVNNPIEEIASVFKFLQLESSNVSEVCYSNLTQAISKSNINKYSLTVEEYRRIAIETRAFCRDYGYGSS
jgi:hypothetical protein